MTSDAQASENRRNAEKSTGPRTEAGKARSSMNALRHGGYVETRSPIVATILDEEPDAMEQLHEDLVHELDPASRAEEMQADAVAQQLINSQRVHQLAARLIDGTENSEEDNEQLESARTEFWLWEMLAEIVTQRQEPVSDDIPYEGIAHAIYHRAPDRTTVAKPHVVEFPGKQATLEEWRDEVIRLVKATIGPLERATYEINVKRCMLDEAVQREQRRASGIEARRQLQILAEFTKVTERVNGAATRTLKDYWEMRQD